MENNETIKNQLLNKKDEIKKISNSKIIKRTLMSLINVASSKTSDDYAWTSVKKLLFELKPKYGFLKYIKIDEIKLINYTIDDIVVDSKLNSIEANMLGMAIQDIVDLLKKYLGKKAGYFFIQEFKSVLGDTYYTIIKNMGVDLRLVELQNELSGVDTGQFKIKDSGSSNIAFIKKTDS